MNTHIHAYVLEQLRSTRLTRAEIAKGSGVPLSTLNKIAQEDIENPGVKHVEALADFFHAGRVAPAGSDAVAAA